MATSTPTATARLGPGFAGVFGASPRPESRLLAALRELKALPALAHSRDRAIASIEHEPYSANEATTAIEADPALTAAVVSAANRNRGGKPAISTVTKAVDVLGRDPLASVIHTVGVFELLEPASACVAYAERYRVHAIKTQRAADHICTVLDCWDRDELHVAPLLHDIGRTWLLAANERYSDILRLDSTPEQRLALERSQVGIDHAMAGGVLLRRLGFPESLARIVETHHSDDADEPAARLRLADMLAHYLAGRPVDREALHQVAAQVGIEPPGLSMLVHGLSHMGPRRRGREPSPLSRRQGQMLRLLADGRTYKQIGAELGLSASTIRTHIHEAYRKLNVVDRAQAVLLAKERGWV